LGAKRSWLDRVFRGEAVTEAEYGAREAAPGPEEPVDAMEVFARHSAAAERTASRKDNLVEFSRAKAGASAETGSFGAATIYDTKDTSRASRTPSGSTKEFSGGSTAGLPTGARSTGGSGGGDSGMGSGAGASGGGGFTFGPPKDGETADAYVVFKRLKDFTMASAVADRMTENKIVILNLESCDDEIARRVLDFIGGVAYACGSMVKRIAGRVFMITPKGVSSDGEFFDEARESTAIRYDD